MGAPPNNGFGFVSAAAPPSSPLRYIRPSLRASFARHQEEDMDQRMAVVLLALFMGLCLRVGIIEGRLQVGFYDRSCPPAEFIVRAQVWKAVVSDNGLAADFVRMHFHDCFVRGCDASITIDSTFNSTAEKDSFINNPSLEGFDVIDNIKSKLEAECQGIVSCADIIAFAARDSIVLSFGWPYAVPAGRRDGRVSLASEVLLNIPAPTFNLTQLTRNFATKGLTQDEMVTLSGAHSIGSAHCSVFSNRLYDFNTPTGQDPSLDPAYAEQLKQQCPQGSHDTNLVVPMDPFSPTVLDTSYYRLVLANRGLFTSDQALISAPATATAVRRNARNAFLFKRKFTAAIVKMGQIGVLTGSQGEIRSNCRVIN